jgi:hypothetical protein
MPIDGFAKLTDYLILPEVKDAAQWRRPDMMYTSDRGPYIFVHSYYYEATGFYNTGVVKGLKLDKAEALLDPRLKGKIIIEDPARPNGGSNAIAALLKAQGPDFVRRLLGDMQPSFMSITRQITDSVARGDAAIIIGGNPEAITQCWHAGGCKDVIRLPHINYILARGLGVLKNAPHKEATKIWINWLLSKEGQETYVREWARTNESGAVLHYTELSRLAPNPYRSLLIDAGAQVRGYASDITRTYATTRGPFQALLTDMDQLQQRLCAQVKPGMYYPDIHLQAHREIGQLLIDHGLIRCSLDQAIDTEVTSTFFPHGIGHLLGLQVHDIGGHQQDEQGTTLPPPKAHPYLRLTRTLEPGMVVTIEPGIYFIPMLLERAHQDHRRSSIHWDRIEALLPFGGIRIEDDVVATEHGALNLSRAAFSALA